MRWQMCKEIARNIGYLMSYEFWETKLVTPGFPTFSIALYMLVSAFIDTIRMLKPNYHP